MLKDRYINKCGAFHHVVNDCALQFAMALTICTTVTQGDNSLGYPADLEVLVGKKMLFKVDITNGNLLHNWRNYGVKRTSDDAELIQMFIKKHNVKVIMASGSLDSMFPPINVMLK